ncbi:DUF2971 domain-containing protein [Rhodococcus wratislaviensis]|uniref:DUF2971 domain-containing protein n=1 Tax=Rhodococcus wratislaviensis TaxID=44752 RepID=UPI00364CD528
MTSDFETAEPTRILWHYTDAAGLNGILANVDQPAAPNVVGSGSFKPVFRATAIEYLNDHQELIHGLQFFQKHILAFAQKLDGIEYKPDEQHEIVNTTAKAAFFRALSDCIDRIADGDYITHIHCYTTSFSQCPDVLSQWRAYSGGTNGFAIGVDPAQFPSAPGTFLRRASFLAPVHYGHDAVPADLTVELQQWLDHFVLPTDPPNPTEGFLDQCVRWLAALAARIKHPGFSEEKEWRYIDLKYSNEPMYRPGGTGLIPYTTLTLPREAIVALYVGPGPTQRENYLAAKGALSRYRYDIAASNVTKSTTPFR